MEEKTFVWTHELNLRLLDLRYENDLLFKKKKQPWKEFRQILLNHGFPDTMTLNHVRKKWSYMYDMYKIAKKSKNKSWPYYKQFEKIFGKTKVLDKYSSWSDEWRLKLITCITEATVLKLDFYNMWRTVERAMRCQNLPQNCCIQDVQGLWHHIRMTFNRKHRMKQKKGVESSDWPLYDAVLEYYTKNDPKYLIKLETETGVEYRQRKTSSNYVFKNRDDTDVIEEEFQWSKDITETFIQIRLQNDWLFRERKWAWNDLLATMKEEYGFPKTLTGREICRKWAATFSEFQKAKATKNKSWVYYNLFELYLGEGNLSLNPLIGWQEEWISHLINARIDQEHLFKLSYKDQSWREVEKRLRSIGLPLDHSLLDLPDIWTHLFKTYRWKKKFANKGILTEQWPYYEAMTKYDAIKDRTPPVIKHKVESQLDNYNDICNDTLDDNDYEDDMKLFDLKQKLELQVKPKFEYLDANQCRSCSNEEGCVNIFEHVDEGGNNLAEKLRIIGDVKVDPGDSLPSQICLNCVKELENAYKFRRKCQEADKGYRKTIQTPCNIKTENVTDERTNETLQIVEIESIKTNDEASMVSVEDIEENFDNDLTDKDIRTIPQVFVIRDTKPEQKSVIRKAAPKVIRKKKKMRKEKYVYYKICDICGKHTRNLKSHLDTHSSGKSYSCDVCDKKFKFKSGLIIHKSIHDPTPRKKCEVCGKTFHILAQYRRHFVYHANERKFECETCGKRFNTLDILRVHSRTHTDERPYSCPECGKTFRTAGCVSRHKRIVHRTKVQ